MKKITIKLKLILTWIVMFSIGLFIFSSLSINLYNSLLDSKKSRVEILVDTASSIVKKEMKLHENNPNKYTKEIAQKKASDAINSLNYENGNYFWIHNYDNIMISHPKSSLVGTNIMNIKDSDGTPLFIEMTETVKKYGSGLIPYKWTKPNSNEVGDKISYVYGIPEWKWIIGTGIYIDDVNTLFMKDFKVNLIIFVISYSLLTIIMFLISKSITTPINETIKAMNDISEGNGDLTKRFDATGSDEISQLKNAFDLFAKKLSNQISLFVPVSESLSDTTKNIKNTSFNMVSNTKEQNDQLFAISASVNEMVSTTSEITKNIAEVAGSVTFIDKELNEVQTQAEGSKEATEHLSTALTDSFNEVSDLVGQAENINEVIHVINSIADQTNLLALNAAIEAARAGDAGRGFAVVADEVRKLASQTQESVQDISKVINEIKDKIEKVSVNIEGTKEFSDSSKTLAEQTLISVEEVKIKNLQVNDMCQQIAVATEEQSSTNEEIHKNIEVVSQSSNDLQNQAEDLNNATESLESANSDVDVFIDSFKI